MANLFDYGDVKNHPRRSGFDLSKRRLFTAKVGELLPVYWRLTYPGDKFKLGVQHFTRTMPVNTAAFTRIREYYDWYWVPLRLINKNIGQALVNMVDNPVQASGLQSARQVVQDIPYSSFGTSPDGSSIPFSGISALLSIANGSSDQPVSVNQFGFKVSACSAKLLKYLGYGSLYPSGYTTVSSFAAGLYGLTSNTDIDKYDVRAVDNNVNLLPLLVYQKIYADYFRFQQWENNEPWTYNADYYNGGNFLSSLNSAQSAHDYVSSNNIFTLRYANWKKDLFMGVMPNSQLGDIATINISGNTDNSGGGIISTRFISDTSDPASNPPVAANAAGVTPGSGVALRLSGAATLPTGTLGIAKSDVSAGGSFNILQLRMSEALQRYREVAQCSDQTYRDQIQAHFGVSLSAALSDKCMWIGGHASNLNIDDVVNTNLTEGNTDIKGKGVASGQGFENFSCDEHGVLMCIYHAEPLLEYVRSGNPRELLYTDTTDLPFPEFDSIGMESVNFLELFNSTSAYQDINPDFTSSILGYAPRYYELKTDIDEVCGAFTTTLQQWVAPINPIYLKTWFDKSFNPSDLGALNINYNWFKINPSLLDNIFIQKADSTWDSDQLWIAAYFDIKAVRNFDYDGMPY